jgi:hypothetical protein
LFDPCSSYILDLLVMIMASLLLTREMVSLLNYVLEILSQCVSLHLGICILLPLLCSSIIEVAFILLFANFPLAFDEHFQYDFHHFYPIRFKLCFSCNWSKHWKYCTSFLYGHWRAICPVMKFIFCCHSLFSASFLFRFFEV